MEKIIIHLLGLGAVVIKSGECKGLLHCIQSPDQFSIKAGFLFFPKPRNRDIFRHIFPYCSIKTCTMTSYYNHFSNVAPVRGHNICFPREIRKNMSELSLLPFLIWSSAKEEMQNNYFLELIFFTL